MDKNNPVFIDADTHSGNTQDPYNSFEQSIEYGHYASEVDYILKETEPFKFEATKYPEDYTPEPVYDPFSFASAHGSTLVLKMNGTFQLLNFDYNGQFPTHVPVHDGTQEQDNGGLIPHNDHSHAPILNHSDDEKPEPNPDPKPIEKVKVTFIDQGKINEEVTLTKGDTVGLEPTPSDREGYCLRGWSLTEDGKIIDLDQYKVNEDTNFYAIWTEIIPTFNVKFMDRGNEVGSATVTRGQKIGLEPSVDPRDDYSLRGWGLSEDATEVINIDTYEVNEDLTLYAIWDAIDDF